MTLLRRDRDLRVDFFRGLALWWIFCDHVPGDALGDWSLRNFALCDATEVFVLLAGFGAGTAYGGAMDRHGWLYAAADAVRRAWTLYIAHIFLFVVFSAQVAYSAAALDRSEYLDEIHLDVLAEQPYRALLEALILRFQPGYLNILPLYVVLLLLFALTLPLLRRPWVLMTLSVALYAAARLVPLNLPSWTGGGWFFNPFAWQLLFAMGALMAQSARTGVPRLQPTLTRAAPLLTVGSCGMLVFGAVVIWCVWGNEDVLPRLPPGLQHLLLGIDKTGLHPARLGSILALVWLVTRLLPASAPWLRGRLAAPLVLIGQHSLPVFCFGIFLAFLGRLAMEADDGVAAQLAVNIVGALALVGVGALAAWYRAKGREVKGAANAAVGAPGGRTVARVLPAASPADTG